MSDSLLTLGATPTALSTPLAPGATPTPASNARAEVTNSRSGVAAPPVVTLPARAAGGLVWVYQKTLSPALAVANPTGGCRFAPTCSHYAREALQEHGLATGLWLTLRRLVKCGPWHPGGEDPVPSRKLSCVRVRSATLANR